MNFSPAENRPSMVDPSGMLRTSFCRRDCWRLKAPSEQITTI